KCHPLRPVDLEVAWLDCREAGFASKLSRIGAKADRIPVGESELTGVCLADQHVAARGAGQGVDVFMHHGVELSAPAGRDDESACALRAWRDDGEARLSVSRREAPVG